MSAEGLTDLHLEREADIVRDVLGPAVGGADRDTAGTAVGSGKGGTEEAGSCHDEAVLTMTVLLLHGALLY